MGNPKQKWTPDEEEALRAGVKKHGTGKWKDIQKDPEFNPFLSSRSNIDLKDKWRNMTVSGLGPREKSRTPKAKANPDAPATPLSNPQTSAAAPVRRDAAAPAVAAAAPFADDSSTVLPDGKAALLCNEMIFEALSSSTDPNGMDTGAIAGFIEQRHEVPQNFRRLLSTRLRRLVAQDKLEKNQNCYKLKSNSSLGTKTPAPPALPAPPVPKPKDVQPRQLHSPFYGTPGDTIGEAAVAAAYKIAEAENKSFVAAEAVKEAERISQMAEDTESLLQLAKDIFEKCSQGEVALMV